MDPREAERQEAIRSLLSVGRFVAKVLERNSESCRLDHNDCAIMRRQLSDALDRFEAAK